MPIRKFAAGSVISLSDTEVPNILRKNPLIRPAYAINAAMRMKSYHSDPAAFQIGSHSITEDLHLALSAYRQCLKHRGATDAERAMKHCFGKFTTDPENFFQIVFPYTSENVGYIDVHESPIARTLHKVAVDIYKEIESAIVRSVEHYKQNFGAPENIQYRVATKPTPIIVVKVE